jgi:hypothetical protein
LFLSWRGCLDTLGHTSGYSCRSAFVSHRGAVRKIIASGGLGKEGFEEADGVIIMNNHPGYRSANIPALANRLRAPAFLFDSWGLFDIRDFREVAGLRYAPLGAPFTSA